jgi:sortase A
LKKRILIFPLLLLLLLGVGLAAYPFVSNYYMERCQSQVYAQYQEAIEKADSKELDAAKRAAEAYNHLLVSGATAAELNAMDYDSLLNLDGSGVMGYVEIPAIDVLLPIYHGVDGDSLERGAGHMPSTSLPIGGKGTHAVISAHTGMASSRMFTDLEQLETGDVFHIHVLEETLTYTVDQILVVRPYQTDALKISAEQDYVTLVTCTPYGVNSHRLLVRGHRAGQTTELPTDADDRNPEIVLENAHKQSTWTAKYWEGVRDGLLIFLIVIAILLPVTLLMKVLKKRKRQ